MSADGDTENEPLVLVIVVVSADNKQFEALSILTESVKEVANRNGYGHLEASFPADPRAVLSGADKNADQYQLAEDREAWVLKKDAAHFLFAVGSRYKRDAPGVLTENLLVNFYINQIRKQAATRNPYSAILTSEETRLSRTASAFSKLIEVCKENNVEVVTNGGVIRPDSSATAAAAIKAVGVEDESDRSITRARAGRKSAHLQGRAGYGRHKTHPLIDIDRHKRMAWDESVVAALRTIVKEWIRGTSPAQLALDHGKKIPAYGLQARSDRPQDLLATSDSQTPSGFDECPRPRTNADLLSLTAQQRLLFGQSHRETRLGENALRVNDGLTPIELAYEADDTTPNPDYRPETILDRRNPAEALRELLFGTACAAITKQQLQMENGQPGADWTLRLFEDGVYARATKTGNPNNADRGYEVAEFFLGPTKDGQSVLTSDQVQFLKHQRGSREHAHRTSSAPLVGVFTVERLDRPLLTCKGQAHSPTRLMKFTATPGKETRKGSYRIVSVSTAAELPNGEPRQINIVTVGTQALGQAIVHSIDHALNHSASKAVFEDHSLSVGTISAVDPRRRLERDLAAASREIDNTMRIVPQVTDETVLNELTQRLNDAAQRRESIAGRIAQLDLGSGEAHQYSGSADVTGLRDLLALLTSGQRSAVENAASVNRLLKSTFKNATIRFDDSVGKVRFSFDLSFVTEDGMIVALPVDGSLENEASDYFLSPEFSRFWHQNKPLSISKPDVRSEREHRLLVGKRLCSSEMLRPMSCGYRAAFFAGCPNEHLIATGLHIARGEPSPSIPDELVRLVEAEFFDSAPASPHQLRWSWGSASRILERFGGL